MITMTGQAATRTGQPGQDKQDKIAEGRSAWPGTEWPEHDSKDKTAGKGHRGQDMAGDRTAGGSRVLGHDKTGQLGQDS
jgi:hypothetical protein